MAFKSFYLRVAVRVAILTLIAFLASYCFIAGFQLRAYYLVAFALISATELIYFLTRFIRQINTLLVSLQQRDLSLHFADDQSPLRELAAEMNKVIDAFKVVSAQREIQDNFLEALVEHMQVGIICVDQSGSVKVVNNAFRDIIGVKPFEKFLGAKLPGTLRLLFDQIKAGETHTISFAKGGVNLSYAVYCSELRISDQAFKILSLHDITSQLNSKEIESWMKLMKVLTHEIMNSIAPIVSLSDTLQKRLSNNVSMTLDSETADIVRSGIDAINTRSMGLLTFSKSYREFSKIPEPNRANVDANQFFSHIERLFTDEFRVKNIAFDLHAEPGPLFIDQPLFTQVLINLIKNALEAVEAVATKRISLVGEKVGNRYHVTITDNGTGIAPEALDKIFIPFFTTKKEGSGVGLAVARQIVQLHGGDISVITAPGQTRFVIVL